MGNYIIYNEDVISGLAQIPNESVQCVVTSPPYWGLRDYGTAAWVGGDSTCNHYRDNKISNQCLTGEKNVEGGIGDAIYKDMCKKCGAKRIDQQLGLEKTPEEYVLEMVKVFREVKRVLKKDGTLWLNLGDTYSSSNESTIKSGNLIKPKDLVGIPWSVAFALRTDGWYLRSDIIYHKINPKPESVKDRPSQSYEHIFLLTKNAKYYFDYKSIQQEPSESYKKDKRLPGILRQRFYKNSKYLKEEYGSKEFKNLNIPGQKPNTMHLLRAKGQKDQYYEKVNCKDVWSIKTNNFKGAHFATFPPEIPVRCIKAGTHKGDTVLDPFAGSGTTGEVALCLERNFIGIELNTRYVKELIIPRLENIYPLFKNKIIGVLS